MGSVGPKTRYDRLVTVRERSEDHALENLAHAQTSLARATARLKGLRQTARADGRAAGTAELWVVEDLAHVRALHDVSKAEGDVAKALGTERTAQAGYAAAHRNAEVVRRAQEKKRTDLVEEREKKERSALDELATLAFNARR